VQGAFFFWRQEVLMWNHCVKVGSSQTRLQSWQEGLKLTLAIALLRALKDKRDGRVGGGGPLPWTGSMLERKKSSGGEKRVDSSTGHVVWKPP
jgi:hypothetical protein